MRKPLQNRIFGQLTRPSVRSLLLVLLSWTMWVSDADAQVVITQSECNCLNNATTGTNGQYRDTVLITTGISGQSWRLLNPIGFYHPQSSPPPAAPLLYFNNSPIPEVRPGVYRIIGKRVSGQSWQFLASNSATGQLRSIASQQTCSYPSATATRISGDAQACPGSMETYSIPANTLLRNISWNIVGGTISGPSNTNSINVVWSNSPGNKEVSVTAQLSSYPLQVNPCPFTSRLLVSVTDVARATAIIGDNGNCGGAVEEYRLAASSSFSNVTWRVTLDTLGMVPSTVVPAPKIGDPNARVITWPQTATSTVYYIVVEGNYKPTAASPNACAFRSVMRVDVVREAGSALACQSQVNLSLNPSCELRFSPSQFLTLQRYPNTSYDIVIRDIEADTIVPNGTVGLKYINKKLEVKVVHECSGNACWGYVLVEDKAIPALECPEDLELECQDVTNIAVTGFPTMPIDVEILPVSGRPNTWLVKNYDKCSDLTMYYTDVKRDTCSGLYSSIITRTWTIKDNNNNTSSCTQTLYVFKAELDDVVFPGNWDTSTGPNGTLEACDPFPIIPVDSLDPNNPNTGHPHPDYTGYPIGTLCLKATVSFRDVEIPICGDHTYKLVRKWTVIDHCSTPARVRTQNQLITIMDTKAPEIQCNPKIDTISTEQHVCGGRYTVAPPRVIKECGKTTWTIEFEIPGQPDVFASENGITKVVKDSLVRINNLPAGLNNLRYTVTDDCGNFAYCFKSVFVQDKVKPTPICQRSAIVAIPTSGIGLATVSIVNAGSHDNCAVDYLKIRKMGTTIPAWSALDTNNVIEFTCAEVGTTVMVELGVWDKSGNFNSCMAEVRVQDNIAPIFNPLASRNVPCSTDLTDLKQFGTPTAKDNCFADIKELDPVRTLNSCGFGTITRRFEVTDKGGNKATTQQVLTITNPNPFDAIDIDWPDNMLNASCAADISPDKLPRANGYPRFLRDTSCSQIIMSYEDVRFNFQENVCTKILRTWTVIDWCQVSATNATSGVFKNTQIIMITNTVKPQITAGCSANDIVITDDLACGSLVTIKAKGKDDCTDTLQLAWKYTIDEGNNGSVEVANGNGSLINRVFPNGTHKVTWQLTDACLNTATCSTTFTIIDEKKPTPICREELVTVIMPSTQSITIKASDFMKEAVDDCSPSNKMRVSFSGTNPLLTTKTYTCDSLGGDPVKEFELKVYAIDEAGNYDFCIVKLRVQANDNACGGFNTATVNIAGRVANESAAELENVNVQLLSDQAEYPKSAMTAQDGSYMFEGLPMHQNYEVAPFKNDDILNGVTTFDVVMIQRHILGLQSLDSPYKIVAADVNNNEKITSSDLVDLRKLILGITSSLPNNQSWRFIDAASPFIDASHPWPLTERMAMNNVDHDLADMNFVAVKVGDVNQSAKTKITDGNIENRTSKSLKANQVSATKGEIINLPILAESIDGLVGLQMGIAFDPKKVELKHIQGRAIKFDQDNIGYNYLSDGRVFVSWSNIEPQIIDNVLMEMTFRALQDIENESIITIDENRIKSEIYTQINGSEISTHSLNLRTIGDGENDSFELFQNIPNPFNSTTKIGFNLPTNDEVTFKVFDLNGKLLYKSQNSYAKGYNTITLDIHELMSNGVMYYQLETNAHSATRKMIVIK